MQTHIYLPIETQIGTTVLAQIQFQKSQSNSLLVPDLFELIDELIEPLTTTDRSQNLMYFSVTHIHQQPTLDSSFFTVDQHNGNKKDHWILSETFLEQNVENNQAITKAKYNAIKNLLSHHNHDVIQNKKQREKLKDQLKNSPLPIEENYNKILNDLQTQIFTLDYVTKHDLLIKLQTYLSSQLLTEEFEIDVYQRLNDYLKNQ